MLWTVFLAYLEIGCFSIRGKAACSYDFSIICECLGALPLANDEEKQRDETNVEESFAKP